VYSYYKDAGRKLQFTDQKYCLLTDVRIQTNLVRIDFT
jgi:hypothetical protein